MYHLFQTVILALFNGIKVTVGIPLNMQGTEFIKLISYTADYTRDPVYLHFGFPFCTFSSGLVMMNLSMGIATGKKGCVPLDVIL